MWNPKHEVTQVAPHTWCLSEYHLVNAFLVEGEQKAALIDTGCGIGNLAETVRELTDKPLIILLTHNHFDHAGGVEQFPGVKVYLHPEDGKMLAQMDEMVKEMLGASDQNELRRFYIETRIPIRYPDADINEMMKLIPKECGKMEFDWEPMTDGMEFDLGGRTLTAIHTPGHTEGEMCILDSTSRILFSGDTANVGIILMRQPNNDPCLIEICRQTMKKLWDLHESYDCLGVGHDDVTVSKQIVKDYLELASGILDGSIKGAYEETGFRKGDVARLGLAELWYQCDQ